MFSSHHRGNALIGAIILALFVTFIILRHDDDGRLSSTSTKPQTKIPSEGVDGNTENNITNANHHNNNNNTNHNTRTKKYAVCLLLAEGTSGENKFYHKMGSRSIALTIDMMLVQKHKLLQLHHDHNTNADMQNVVVD
eukprot:PhF_6_TR6373/c0_g1_i1/m.9630